MPLLLSFLSGLLLKDNQVQYIKHIRAGHAGYFMHNNTLFVEYHEQEIPVDRGYPYRGYPLCKSKQLKSNQLNSTQIKSNQIKSNFGFWGEGKTGVPGEKPLGAE